MSWKPWLSALGAAALLAGCSAGQTGPTSPAGQAPLPATAEAMKERLANQARAIAELSAESDKLLAKIAELRAEIARLEAQLKGPGAPASTPAPPPAPTPAPAPPPAGKK